MPTHKTAPVILIIECLLRCVKLGEVSQGEENISSRVYNSDIIKKVNIVKLKYMHTYIYTDVCIYIHM